MHTKRKGYIRNRQHSRRRHSLGRRSRRAGTLSHLRRLSSAIPNLNLSHLNPFSEKHSGVRPLLYAINKTYTRDVTKREGIYNNEPSLFTGKMRENGQYISGNLFYRERNGKMVGVHATKFHNNSPCGIVTRIHLTGEPILDTHNRPIVETVTCGSDHVDSYPFYQ